MFEYLDRIGRWLGRHGSEAAPDEQGDALDTGKFQLQRLAAVAQRLSQPVALEALAGDVIDTLIEDSTLLAGSIWLRDQGSSQLKLAAVRRKSETPADELPLAYCLQCGPTEAPACQCGSGHPHCRCLSGQLMRTPGPRYQVCVPLAVGSHVLGVCRLTALHTRPLRDERQCQQYMLTLGQEIGVGIENALLRGSLQREQARCEAAEVRLLSVQAEERKRLARELHDEASQSLTLLQLGLKVLGQTSDPREMQAQARQLQAIAAQALDEVHQLAARLRPGSLDDAGLPAAVERLVAGYAHAHAHIELQAISLEDRRLPPLVEDALYHVVQEALTNAVRHAQAEHIDILLEVRKGAVLALVEDDGCGFDVQAALDSGQADHLGLRGMQERAELVGGWLCLESFPHGTTVVVTIPLSQHKAGSDAPRPHLEPLPYLDRPALTTQPGGA